MPKIWYFNRFVTLAVHLYCFNKVSNHVKLVGDELFLELDGINITRVLNLR